MPLAVTAGSRHSSARCRYAHRTRHACFMCMCMCMCMCMSMCMCMCMCMSTGSSARWQAFVKYDTDGSGAIDVEELRNALRRLGLRAGALEATNIFRRYDADESGTIELHEFAVLVRDLQLYASFDTNCDGAIDEGELHEVLQRLKLKTTEAETRAILHAWDPDMTGALDLPKFSQLVGDLRTFRDHDLDKDGKLSQSELRVALRSLGIKDTEQAALRELADKNAAITLCDFASIVRKLTNGQLRIDADVAPLIIDGTSFTSKSKLTGNGAPRHPARRRASPRRRSLPACRHERGPLSSDSPCRATPLSSEPLAAPAHACAPCGSAGQARRAPRRCPRCLRRKG